MNFMHSSTKRYNMSPFHSQSTKKQQNISKSTSKKFGAFSRSPSLQEEHEIQVKKLMTSNAYNNVFNRLTNLNELKEFVKQSAQYVQFHQQEVKRFIPAGQNERKRFSFSLKTSIYSFITKDYRFLRHYLTLLQKQFPDKKDKLRQELFQQFKDTVIDRKKFYAYFSSNEISKLCKSFHKPIKSTTSIQKTMKNQNQSCLMKQKSLKEKIQYNKTPEKTRKDISVHSKDKIYEISKNKIKTTNPKQIKLQKQSTINLIQNNPNLMNLQLKKQRRTTMQNIKIIGDTLYQIQMIFSQTSSINNKKSLNIKNDSISQIKTGDQQYQFLQQSLNLLPNKNIKVNSINVNEQEKHESTALSHKFDSFKDKKMTQDPSQKELAQNQNDVQEKLISRRSINKSKKKKQQPQDDRNIRLLGIQNKNSKYKSTLKKQRKIVPFSQIFDVNDPENKQILKMVEHFQKQRQEQSKDKEDKQKTTNELLKKIRFEVSIFKKEVRRSFSSKEKQLLTPEESDIVNLFPQITQIGGFKHFQYDRNCFLHKDFGEFKGYKIEQVLSWPKIDNDDEAFKCLYLTKLKDECQRDQTSKQLQSIDELKMKVSQNEISGVTLLIIQK